jgi:hypothetical protein
VLHPAVASIRIPSAAIAKRPNAEYDFITASLLVNNASA